MHVRDSLGFIQSLFYIQLYVVRTHVHVVSVIERLSVIGSVNENSTVHAPVQCIWTYPHMMTCKGICETIPCSFQQIKCGTSATKYIYAELML